MSNVIDFANKEVQVANQAAALAYQSYLSGGRCALVADIDNCFGRNTATGTSWWNVHPNSPAFDDLKLSEPERVIAIIEQYDPESECVVIALKDGQMHVVIAKDKGTPYLTPPEAYRIIGDQRPEPGPLATIHSLADWNGDGAA